MSIHWTKGSSVALWCIKYQWCTSVLKEFVGMKSRFGISRLLLILLLVPLSKLIFCTARQVDRTVHRSRPSPVNSQSNLAVFYNIPPQQVREIRIRSDTWRRYLGAVHLSHLGIVIALQGAAPPPHSRPRLNDNRSLQLQLCLHF